MITTIEIQDIESQVDELILQWDVEFDQEYNRPVLELIASIAVATAPPEVLAGLPKDAVKKVQEFGNG